MGVASSQGIDQPPLIAQRKGVTHVPGLLCYPCTRSVPCGGLTPISPPVVKGKDVPRSVVELSARATVRNSVRITVVPFVAVFVFSAGFHPDVGWDTQHLLRLLLHEVKREGRWTHAA